MQKRSAALITGVVLAGGGAAGAMAAGPKAPHDGHYANHPNGKLTKNALDFDVVKANVTAISHYDKCVTVPIRWPDKIAFRKGVFALSRTLQDVVGSSFAVKFTGTAVSSTRINGVLDIKVTKSKSSHVKKGCHFTLDYKAKRVGPPAGVV
jgi:hypothetical protein